MHIHDDVPRTAILRAARLQSSDVLGRLLVRNVEGRLRQLSSARVQVEVDGHGAQLLTRAAARCVSDALRQLLWRALRCDATPVDDGNGAEQHDGRQPTQDAASDRTGVAAAASADERFRVVGDTILVRYWLG